VYVFERIHACVCVYECVCAHVCVCKCVLEYVCVCVHCNVCIVSLRDTCHMYISPPNTHTYTHSMSASLSFFPVHSRTLLFFLALSCSLSLSLTQSRSLSLSLTRSRSLLLSHSLARAHFLSFYHLLSLTHTHTHTFKVHGLGVIRDIVVQHSDYQWALIACGGAAVVRAAVRLNPDNVMVFMYVHMHLWLRGYGLVFSV